MADANWELKNCCNHDQISFLVTVGCFTLAILLLWRTFVLTPFKLITVFLHETSHALACKLTCGDVEGMQVHADEGGVTQTHGGIYWLILPAGCKAISWIIILGTSFNTCIYKSSCCKNCGWMSCNCFAYSALCCQKLVSSRTMHWFYYIPGHHLAVARNDHSPHPSLCNFVYRCDE